jgi:hypothetical protein
MSIGFFHFSVLEGKQEKSLRYRNTLDGRRGK